MNGEKVFDLIEKAKNIRLWAIEETASKGKGHIGGTFSCVDILVSLYYSVLNIKPKHPEWDGRDRFILSKGHACLALYPILMDLGFINNETFRSYGENGGLGGQLDISIPGVDWNTGSLGHSLGIASGMAMASKLDNKNYHVFSVVGDGECAEGSIWESIMFIGQRNISNITCIVDRNRLSVTETLDDDSFFKNLSIVLPSFGWGFVEINGHNIEEITIALNSSKWSKTPTFIVANTIKGKGISFMENVAKWHNSVPNKDELEAAKAEINAN
jgi:transketolase